MGTYKPHNIETSLIRYNLVYEAIQVFNNSIIHLNISIVLLSVEPIADCARYDALRQEVPHATAMTS
ncbi:hypothetical protein [Desulfofustis limnaeus]|uniref:hypothetical protein n=1 Tax=Desulfofustis limnaeus TaxID=2740163 RepID=UPI0024DFDEEF|nr:hypothetical protein [Desulfofustis limnaeus]MDX9896347.1 hypothetical protein [Desulfofustis sp.]